MGSGEKIKKKALSSRALETSKRRLHNAGDRADFRPIYNSSHVVQVVFASDTNTDRRRTMISSMGESDDVVQFM